MDVIKKYKPILLGLVLLVVGGYFYKYRFSNKSVDINCKDCNVILVSFDTLKAYHVHNLGYFRNTTPTLDTLAKNGFNFTNDVSASSWTLPSTMSIITGLLPTEHKIVNKTLISKDGKEATASLKLVSPQIKTIAEVLKVNGYKTAGFTGGAGVDHTFGFNSGFDEYYDEKNFGGFEDSIPKALEWIGKNKDQKFFVFLHGYDIHGQYAPKEGYDKRFVDFNYKGKLNGSTEEQKQLREDGLLKGNVYLSKDDVRFLNALYDEKIQRADARFGQFMDQIKQMGLTKKTIIVITADHGDEFYEHGQIDHGHSLYEELIRVPLIIVTPGQGGKKINEQVSSIDIMPTILDLVGSRETPKMTGVSLKPLMDNKKMSPITAFSETEYRYTTFEESVRSPDGWKLILNKDTGLNELYNLKKDKSEKNNLIRDKMEKANELKMLIVKNKSE